MIDKWSRVCFSRMIGVCPYLPDICPDLGGVSPDQSRQQVEPRFVLENQHPVLALRPLAQFGPDRRTPVLDGLFVSLDGPPNWHLGGPLQFLQEPANVPLVVADAEFLFDNLGDTAASPDLAAEAIILLCQLGRYSLWHAHEFTQQQLLGRFEPEPVADLAMYLR